MEVSASWKGVSNKSVPISVTSTSPDQREIEDLGYYFVNLNESLSSYCLNIQESRYFSWRTTNTQKTSVVTCTQNVTDSSCDNPGTYTETYPPQYTPTSNLPVAAIALETLESPCSLLAYASTSAKNLDSGGRRRIHLVRSSSCILISSSDLT